MIKTTIGKSFDFEASHQLPDKECYGKCRNLHGHRYELFVEVTGPVDEEYGWICNFSEVKSIVESEIIQKLDHQHLNNILPTIPTAENIAAWIFKTLDQALEKKTYKLNKLKLYETARSYAELTRE